MTSRLLSITCEDLCRRDSLTNELRLHDLVAAFIDEGLLEASIAQVGFPLPHTPYVVEYPVHSDSKFFFCFPPSFICGLRFFKSLPYDYKTFYAPIS